MNQEQARELLPWYAAGSLDDEEARQVAELVEKDEELAQELNELRLVQGAIEEVGDEEPEFRSEMIQEALQQIDRMEAENAAHHSVEDAADETADRSTSTNWSQKVSEAASNYLNLLQWNATPAFARVAVIGQLAVVGLLSVALISNNSKDIVSETLSGSQEITQTRQLLSLAFNEGVTEMEMRQYLNSLKAEIVSGPTALGIYTVAVNESFDMQTMLPQIKESALIQYAAPVLKQ